MGFGESADASTGDILALSVNSRSKLNAMGLKGDHGHSQKCREATRACAFVARKPYLLRPIYGS